VRQGSYSYIFVWSEYQFSTNFRNIGVVLFDYKLPGVCINKFKMTEPARPEKVTIEGWLADLHMECYKKQLEDFDTIKVRKLFEFVLACWIHGSIE